MDDPNVPKGDDLKTIETQEKFSKKMMAALIAADVWDEKNDNLKYFKSIDPKDTAKVAEWDEKKGEFNKDKTKFIWGAEYRKAFVVLAAYSDRNKLDEDDRKLLYKELFNQETMPNPKAAKDEATRQAEVATLKRGLDKLKAATLIIGGEFAARPAKEAPMKKDGVENQGQDNMQSSTGPDVRGSIAAIDNMDALLSGTTREGGKPMDSNMVDALLIHAEAQLSNALKGRRAEALGMPFKAIQPGTARSSVVAA